MMFIYRLLTNPMFTASVTSLVLSARDVLRLSPPPAYARELGETKTATAPGARTFQGLIHYCLLSILTLATPGEHHLQSQPLATPAEAYSKPV